ncbi:hypothetical protein ACHAWF_011181 [Thalassiosira exigua]
MIEKFAESFKDQLPDGHAPSLHNHCDNLLAYYCFCKDVDDLGILRWMVEERSKEVNFFDLTIKINDSNQIKTRT